MSSSLDPQGELASNKNYRFPLNSLDDDLLTRELTLRSTPLRSVWEARGAGAWQWCRRVGLLNDNSEYPIVIQPVLPFHSGGSTLDRLRRSIQIEALLHDTHWHSPEWLRILRQVARLGMLQLFDLQHPSTASNRKNASTSTSRLTLALAAADLVTEWGAEWVEVWQPGNSQLHDRDELIGADARSDSTVSAENQLELRESLRLSAPHAPSQSPAAVATWLKELSAEACSS